MISKKENPANKENLIGRLHFVYKKGLNGI